MTSRFPKFKNYCSISFPKLSLWTNLLGAERSALCMPKKLLCMPKKVSQVFDRGCINTSKSCFQCTHDKFLTLPMIVNSQLVCLMPLRVLCKYS